MVFNPYGPLHFRRSLAEEADCPYIPANPPADLPRPDISLQRDREVAHEDRRWRSKGMWAAYGAEKKELHYHWFSNFVDGAEFNRTLGYWRADRLADVQTICMWVSSAVAREQLFELEANGYRRDEIRETDPKYPALCFVSTGRPKQWK